MAPRKGGVRTILSLLFAIAIAMLTYFLQKQAMDSPYRISPLEAKRRLQAREFEVVLDVRTDLERSTLGSYPNSLSIQGADLESQIPEQIPDQSADILVQCNSGQRARKATEKLHALGYKNAVQIATPQITLF